MLEEVWAVIATASTISNCGHSRSARRRLAEYISDIPNNGRRGQDLRVPEDLSLEEAHPWWMETPPAFTVVAVEEDVVLGSAKMGPNRPGRGSHIATASFMVDPAKQGRGVGTALGNYVIEWARTHGYRGMQFNAVVETNVPAVHLWQKLGFEVLTTVPGPFDHSEYGFVGLHVMYKSL